MRLPPKPGLNRLWSRVGPALQLDADLFFHSIIFGATAFLAYAAPDVLQMVIGFIGAGATLLSAIWKRIGGVKRAIQKWLFERRQWRWLSNPRNRLAETARRLAAARVRFDRILSAQAGLLAERDRIEAGLISGNDGRSGEMIPRGWFQDLSALHPILNELDLPAEDSFDPRDDHYPDEPNLELFAIGQSPRELGIYEVRSADPEEWRTARVVALRESRLRAWRRFRRYCDLSMSKLYEQHQLTFDMIDAERRDIDSLRATGMAL